jgi:hypothetical protein
VQTVQERKLGLALGFCLAICELELWSFTSQSVGRTVSASFCRAIIPMLSISMPSFAVLPFPVLHADRVNRCVPWKLIAESSNFKSVNSNRWNSPELSPPPSSDRALLPESTLLYSAHSPFQQTRSRHP